MADSHGLAKVVVYRVSPSEELIILLVSTEVNNLVKRFTKKQNSCLELLAQCLMQNIKKIWSLQTILPTPQLSLVIIKLSKINVKPACITKPNVRLLQASSFLSHLLSVESALFYDPNLHKKCTYLTLVNSLCTGCPFHQSQETHKLLASSAGKLHDLNFSRNVICKATMFSHQYNVVSPTISSLFTLCLAGQQNWAVMCLQPYNCMRYFLPLALLDKNTKYQLKKFFE